MKKKSPMMILLIVLLSMTAGAVCFNKVSPILTILIDQLNLTGNSQGGILISIFVFSGIFLAIPSGMIISKFGIYRVGAVALASLSVGSLVGIVGANYPFMLASRVVEGIGLVLLSTIGPVVAVNIFSDEQSGSAMGILMTYLAIGEIVALNLAPRLATAFSWKTVWWGTAVFSVIMLMVWLVMLRGIDDICNQSESISLKEYMESFKEILKNKSLWNTGIVILIYLVTQLGVISFWATYLHDVRGFDSAMAGTYVSVASLVGIPVAIIAGMICDKLGTKRYPFAILMIVSAFVYIAIPLFPSNCYIIMILLFGVVTMGIMGIGFSMLPFIIEKPEHIEMATAFLNMLQWVGIFLSSTLFGLAQDRFGWQTSFFLLAPLTAIGGLLALTNKKVK